jgi:hypothetical protein
MVRYSPESVSTSSAARAAGTPFQSVIITSRFAECVVCPSRTDSILPSHGQPPLTDWPWTGLAVASKLLRYSREQRPPINRLKDGRTCKRGAISPIASALRNSTTPSTSTARSWLACCTSDNQTKQPRNHLRTCFQRSSRRCPERDDVTLASGTQGLRLVANQHVAPVQPPWRHTSNHSGSP